MSPRYLFFVILFASVPAIAQGPILTPNVSRSPYDCAETPPPTNPRSRRLMKVRGPELAKTYTAYNKGKAIDLAEWFRYTCGLNKFVAADLEDKPIEGAENVTVNLTGYIVAVKFNRTGDGDMHIELAASPGWNGDHVVIEMSPGKDFCKARGKLWKMVEKDGCSGDECILRKPVKVEVKGYLLLGSIPQGTTDYCNAISARGIKDAAHEPRSRGIWRLQPVISLKQR